MAKIKDSVRAKISLRTCHIDIIILSTFFISNSSDLTLQEYLITRNLVCQKFQNLTLREKCLNMELFLVRIFLYSDRIRRFIVRVQEYAGQK